MFIFPSQFQPPHFQSAQPHIRRKLLVMPLSPCPSPLCNHLSLCLTSDKSIHNLHSQVKSFLKNKDCDPACYTAHLSLTALNIPSPLF